MRGAVPEPRGLPTGDGMRHPAPGRKELRGGGARGRPLRQGVHGPRGRAAVREGRRVVPVMAALCRAGRRRLHGRWEQRWRGVDAGHAARPGGVFAPRFNVDSWEVLAGVPRVRWTGREGAVRAVAMTQTRLL